MHQAAEHTLRALLLSLTNSCPYSHNLQLLLRQCVFCAPALPALFPQDTEREKELFNLLNSAYVSTRYKNDYHISRPDLLLLLDRVNQLHLAIHQALEAWLQEWEEPAAVAC